MKHPHMLLTALVLTLSGALGLLASPARAQTFDPSYPVCMQVYQGIADFYYECSFTTIPQCQASASGRYASCLVNPYYGGQKRPARKKRSTG